MPDIQTLRRMIHPNARVPLVNHHKKAYAILKEADAPDSTVRINGLPQDAVVIKIDDAFRNDQFFSGEMGECKRADYAIISEAGDKKRILYIEMKRRNKQRTHIIKQLKGAECVMDYCCKIASVFYDEADFLSEFEPRFISFGHTAIKKRRTRITRSASTNETPETMMKIDWPANIQFNRIAG